ncbi:hypothetical protein Tco_1209993 [Tanacetum coccineum]
MLDETIVKQKRNLSSFIDVIKNSYIIKASTIFAMSLKFHATVWKILDICPRKEGEDFTEVQNDEDTLTFLVDLGYSGHFTYISRICLRTTAISLEDSAPASRAEE